MNTIRHLIYREVLRAVGFVALAFLALFFFFDLVDALGQLERGAGRGYHAGHALLNVALQVRGPVSGSQTPIPVPEQLPLQPEKA